MTESPARRLEAAMPCPIIMVVYSSLSLLISSNASFYVAGTTAGLSVLISSLALSPGPEPQHAQYRAERIVGLGSRLSLA